jgi:hypothetical protein
MPKVVITHGVADMDKWLKGKSERAEAIGGMGGTNVGGMGGTNVVDHVAHGGDKTVAITFDTDDVDAVMATLAAPPAELTAAMERHGVVPPLTAYVER